ncbi:hypothetical protein OC845_005752, partial [Tilletia horrida]
LWRNTPSASRRAASTSAAASAAAPSTSTSNTYTPSSSSSSLASSSASDLSKDVSLPTDANAVAKFVDLGLPRPLARQLIAAYPHIKAPTLAQVALLDALPKPNDIILRAHTGTGKSFALLLGLLAKPRVLFPRNPAASPLSTDAAQHGIASIVVVPSNELAFQYLAWARALLPQSGPELHPIIQVLVRGHPTLSAEAQIDLLRNSPPHLLIATPTRIMELLNSKTNDGATLLGLSSLRTVALDEADALLDLPGRFPTHKLKWKHTVHPAPALVFLNELMRYRPSCSGGSMLPSAGLEREEGRYLDERRPPEAIRRTAHMSREALESKQQQSLRQQSAAGSFYSAFNFAIPLPRYGPSGSPPVQLVVTSATANAVLRHFFGARTGWLRTGVKDSVGRPHGQSSSSIQARKERVTGVWLDLSGLTKASAELTLAISTQDKKSKKAKERESQNSFPSGAEGSISAKLREEAAKLDAPDESMYPCTMPEELTHYCIVVDEPDPESGSAPSSPPRSSTGKDADLASMLPPMRNLDPRAFIRPYRKALDLMRERGQPDLATTIRSVSVPVHELDIQLLSALAFAFASDQATRALALIPPQWSLRKTKEALKSWQVPVRLLDGEDDSEPEADQGSDSPVLYLLQATSARGLDLPTLSHVFIVGIESVGDAVRYTHLAGRASRIGSGSEIARIPSLPPATAEDAQHEGDSEAMQSSAPETLQPLRPLGKVVTILRGLPHAFVARRRAALQAWASLSKAERAERGIKRPQHDAIMVSSAERKFWTVWRRTGISGRKKVRVGGIGKWDLSLVGGEAGDDLSLDDWEIDEEADDGGVEEEIDEDEEDDGVFEKMAAPERSAPRRTNQMTASAPYQALVRPQWSSPRQFRERPERDHQPHTWDRAPARSRRVNDDDRLEFGDSGSGYDRPRRTRFPNSKFSERGRVPASRGY